MNAYSPIDPASYREKDPRRRLIVALDTSDPDQALKLAERLRTDVAYVKVGLQLFTAGGPDIVRRLVSLGLEVFLDLKFHDIPNTMAGGVTSSRELGARLTTVHALAVEGVGAAARAAAEGPRNDRSQLGVAILAVTVLTSHAEGSLEGAVSSSLDTGTLVERLGRSAIEQGAAGLVASPLEVRRLREAIGPDPLLVIPGIRPAGSAADDQARRATPSQALNDGADFLVVGRPITKAPDPIDAARRILDEMQAAE